MKRSIVPLLLAALLALVISGCSSTATSTAPPSTSPTATLPTSTAPTTAPTSTAPTTSKPATSTPAPSTPATATAAPGTPKRGGTMVDIEASGPGTPFGWPPELAGGAGITAQIGLDQLLHEDYKGNIIPNLATSYDVVTDPKNPSITFHLRKGVKFHDGTDFNAQAVKWNFEMSKSGVNPSTTNLWKSFDILDDYTIRINLTRWQNTIIRNFSGISAVLCSPAAYQAKGVDYLRWNMVGTGAFKQVEYVNDVRLVTTRFADYWETGKPYLDGLTMLYVTDQMTRLALFKSGGGDVMGVIPKDANDLQKLGYPIINYPAAAYVLVPDSANANSPWANIKVRMAAEYSLDKEAMSKAFGYGFNPPAYQLAPSTNPAIVPGITGRKYDVAKAKQLLAEAGYPNGFKTTIITSSTLDRDGAQAIQAYFAAVGIQAGIDFVEAAKLTTVTTGPYSGILYHQLRPFPNFNADLALEFGNPTTFYKVTQKPDGWNDMLAATLASPAPDPVLMQKASQMLYDDCTMIPTTYYASLYVTQPYVRDTGRGAMGSTTQFTPYNAWFDK